MFKSSIYSILLRSFSLAGRFILLLCLARFLTPDEVGIYGLFAVSIALMLYFAGLDFYTFNTREILMDDRASITLLIRDQLVLHCLLYICLLPVTAYLLMSKFLPVKHLVWLYPILIGEHLSQESYRLFVTLSRPVVANTVLFIRNGAWAYAVVAIMYAEPAARKLQTIWAAWCFGGMLALAVTFYFLQPLDWHTVKCRKINWAWIKKGVGQSLVFLGATLALRAVEASDRFFIEFYHSTSMVGVYTFYASVSNVMLTFISTGILMIYHPLIVRSFQQKDYTAYQRHFRKMAVLAAIGVLVIGIIASGGIYILLYFINKPVYEMYLPVFYLMLINVGIIVISHLPHYGLYVRRQDKSLLFSSLLSFAAALILNAVWVPKYHIYGAALSTLAAMIVLALSKYFFLVRYIRQYPCHV